MEDRKIAGKEVERGKELMGRKWHEITSMRDNLFCKFSSWA